MQVPPCGGAGAAIPKACGERCGYEGCDKTDCKLHVHCCNHPDCMWYSSLFRSILYDYNVYMNERKYHGHGMMCSFSDYFEYYTKWVEYPYEKRCLMCIVKGCDSLKDMCGHKCPCGRTSYLKNHRCSLHTTCTYPKCKGFADAYIYTCKEHVCRKCGENARMRCRNRRVRELGYCEKCFSMSSLMCCMLCSGAVYNRLAILKVHLPRSVVDLLNAFIHGDTNEKRRLSEDTSFVEPNGTKKPVGMSFGTSITITIVCTKCVSTTEYYRSICKGCDPYYAKLCNMQGRIGILPITALKEIYISLNFIYKMGNYLYQH